MKRFTRSKWALSAIGAVVALALLISPVFSTHYAYGVDIIPLPTETTSPIIAVSVVGDGIDDQVEIQGAIDAVSATGVHGTVTLQGTFECSAGIIAKSNVDVVGMGATVIVTAHQSGHGYGVLIRDVSNAEWRNVKVIKRGSARLGSTAIRIDGNTDDSFKLTNCEGIVDDPAGYHGIGIFGNAYPVIRDCRAGGGQRHVQAFYVGPGGLVECARGDSPHPLLINCYGKSTASDPSIGNNSGLDIDGGYPTVIGGIFESSDYAPGSGICLGYATTPTLIGCTGIGSRTIYGQSGILIAGNVAATLRGCTGIAGYANGAIGINTTVDSKSILIGCEGVMSPYGVNSCALQIYQRAATIVSGFNAHPVNYSRAWFYVPANNGRFLLVDAGVPYVLTSIRATAWVAIPGQTLDIGSSIGGNDIADDVDIGTFGDKFIELSPKAMPADGYLYATPSGGTIGPTDLMISTAAYANLETNYGLWMRTTGHAKVTNSQFWGHNGVRVLNDFGDINWQIYGSTFESIFGWALDCPVIPNVPIYNSGFEGGVSNPEGLHESNIINP